MKNYIAVIKTTEGSEMYNFTSDKDRQEFIDLCKKMDSYQKYAIATTDRKDEMANSDFIQLSCELAHNRVKEDEPVRGVYCAEGEYTEAGQDVFNEYYDYYQGILSRYIIEEKK